MLRKQPQLAKGQTASSVNNRRLEYVQWPTLTATAAITTTTAAAAAAATAAAAAAAIAAATAPSSSITVTTAAARRWLHRHSPLPPPSPVARRYQERPGTSGPVTRRSSRFRPKVVWNTAFLRSSPASTITRAITHRSIPTLAPTAPQA